MPIPFAEIDSEDSGLWNLQLHFWRNAVEHFEQMNEHMDDYDDDEAEFGVDASMVVVLAGTSISQLLGQQWRDGNVKVEGDDRVPQMGKLLRRLIENASKEHLAALFPADTPQPKRSLT